MSAHLESSPSINPPLVRRLTEVKAVGAFRTISEVASGLDVPQHVLRFWESKFQQIKPLKRGGGRRYYRPEDVDLLTNIKDLLYNQGFTIRGVQKILKDGTRRSLTGSPPIASTLASPVASPVVLAPARGLPPEKRLAIENVVRELKALRELLRQGGV